MYFMSRIARSYLLISTRFEKVSHGLGAYGMTISGAGPSLFVAVQQGTEKEIAEKLAAQFPYYECIATFPSVNGAKVK